MINQGFKLQLSLPSSVLLYLLQQAAADETLLDVTVACKHTLLDTLTPTVCVCVCVCVCVVRENLSTSTHRTPSLSLSLSLYLSACLSFLMDK